MKDVSTLKILFNSLVRSKLEFASVIWSPCNVGNTERIEGIQRRFLKFCYWKEHHSYPSRGADYEPLLREFELDSLEDRRRQIAQQFMCKILANKIDCPDLLGRLPFLVPHSGSRNCATFYVKTPKSSFLTKSPIWNLCKYFCPSWLWYCVFTLPFLFIVVCIIIIIIIIIVYCLYYYCAPLNPLGMEGLDLK